MFRTSTHRIRKAGTALALGLAAAILAVSAQAGAPVASAQPHDSVVVRYDDVNLGTTSGAQVLYARITSAAERACGAAPSVREMRQQRAYRGCVDTAVDHAVKQIDSQRLQALHAEHRADASVS